MLQGFFILWATIAHLGVSHGENMWSLCTGNLTSDCESNSSCLSVSPLPPEENSELGATHNRLVFPTLQVCDACVLNPCHNGGLCKNLTRGAFYCNCKDGYVGNVCEERCECTEPGEECGMKNGTCVCKTGFKKNSAGKCKRFCEEATLHSAKCKGKNYTFPQTTVNSLAQSSVKCGTRGEATIKCVVKSDGTFGFDLEYMECLGCDITVNNISQLVQKNATVDATLSKIALLTSTNETVPVEQAAATVNYLDETSKVVKNTTVKEVYSVMVIAEKIKGSLIPVSSTSNDSETGSATANETSAIEERNKIVSSIERFGLNLNMEDVTTVVIETDTMLMQASKPAVVTAENKTEYSGVTFPQPTAESSATPKTTGVLFTISKNLIEEMSNRAIGGSLQLVFVLHQDDSLFTNGSRVNQVVQASFNHEDTTSTAFPIPFTLEHDDPRQLTKEENQTGQFKTQNQLKTVIFEYFCVYYDIRTNSWAQDGCSVTKVDSRHSYICTCTHFTSFALLLKIKVVRDEVEKDLFSLIACSVSIVGLIMTMVIYLAVPELRRRKPTPILINFCICLCIGYFFFVVGIDKANYQQDNVKLDETLENFCYASSFLMHTGLLSAWFWMLVYSLNIYYAMVRVVAHSAFVGKKLFMYSVGYVLPILMIAINFIVAVVLDGKKEKGFAFESDYRAPYMCWIYKYSLYFVFLLPVGIILLINFVLFFLVLRKLTWKRKEIQSNKQSLDWKQQLFMAASMMAMMGLTWVFGFLMLIHTNGTYVTIMGTLFNVCNTTQGIVIFLVSCIRQKNVRDLWFKPLLRTLGCYKCFHPKGAEPLSSSSQAFSTNTTKNMSTLPRGSNATMLNNDTLATSRI